MDRKPYFISFILLLSVLLCCCLLSCDDSPIGDGNASLSFSTDTVMFDTVFTTIGSSTREMKIYNKYDDDLLINEITLAGGSSSQFSINLNGMSGTHFTNVEIPYGDSIYLFAKVRINPNDINNPFVVEDDIVFNTNGKEQTVKLLAWGQNANYIIATDSVGSLKLNIIAHENEIAHWTAERPYVIIGGYAAVDSLGTLIVDAGAHIYLHKGSGIWIYRYGNIIVNGTSGNEVIFESDRLEPEYDNVSAMWDRIWINEGPVRNEFHHTVIRNGFIGIQAESLSLSEYWSDNLLLDNVKIENMSGMGIYAVLYSINAGNVLVDNCGSYLVGLTLGGEYDFRNCTFANFWNSSIRQTSSIYVNNYYLDENYNPVQVSLNDYYFGNCVVYGVLENELYLDGVGTFNCSLQNSLVKIARDRIEDYSKYFTDCIINKSPIFSDSTKFNYHIDTIISPLINAGSMEIVNSSPIDISKDLDGVSRTNDDNPDIGAYEFVEPL